MESCARASHLFYIQKQDIVLYSVFVFMALIHEPRAAAAVIPRAAAAGLPRLKHPRRAPEQS